MAQSLQSMGFRLVVTPPDYNDDIVNEKSYWEKGYAVFRGIFNTEEVANLQREADCIWGLDSINKNNLRVEFRKSILNEYIPDRLDPVLDISPLFSEMVSNNRLLHIVQGLLSRIFINEQVQILRCKLIMKESGTPGYTLHTDYPYWKFIGLDPNHFITVFIAIDDADEESGALAVYPYTHTMILPVNPKDEFDIDEEEFSKLGLVSIIPELKAGDVLAFHSLLAHKSGMNLSLHSRRVLLPTYVPATFQSGKAYDKYYEWYIQCRKAMQDRPGGSFLK
ncbi:phytanoyl-CoA dioxygenase family protein [Microcoleus sp. F4-D5]|uniref:phytanoyl-CoA dioxygenase family protein n=1 Tax=Microcoleus sp. F4-D5 TaxID=2818760 RepID=UPI002FD1D71C